MAGIAPDTAAIEIALVDQVNKARTASALGTLDVSPALSSVARSYASLLATTGKFAHDADGSTASRVARGGYMACAVGENIAMRRGLPMEASAMAASILEGWQKSPVHLANLMAAGISQTGVGIAVVPKVPGADAPKEAGAGVATRGAVSGAVEIIAVELFARPASQRVAFTVVNQANAEIAVQFGGASRTISTRSRLKVKSCAGGEVAFATPGAKTIVSRYASADGVTYTVTGTAGGTLQVKERR